MKTRTVKTVTCRELIDIWDRGQIEMFWFLNGTNRFGGGQSKGNEGSWGRRRPRRLVWIRKRLSSRSTKVLLELGYSSPFLMPSPIGFSCRFSSSLNLARIALIWLFFGFLIVVWKNLEYFPWHGSDSCFFFSMTWPKRLVWFPFLFSTSPRHFYLKFSYFLIVNDRLLCSSLK